MNQTNSISISDDKFSAVEVEKHLIGALLIDAEVAQQCVTILQPADFYVQAHSAIWDVISRFTIEAQSFTIHTVAERLRGSKYGDLTSKAMEILGDIRTEVVSSANAEAHAKIILGHSNRRKLREIHRKIGRAIEDPEQDIEKILLSMESQAVALRSGMESSSGLRVVPAQEWIKDALDAYDKTVYRGESTGWKNLDTLYRVAPGQLNVVTGIPNHGKSEVLDAMMLNLAVGSDWQIAYWSPENNPLRRHIQKLAEKAVGKHLYGDGRMTLAEYYEALHKTVATHFRFLGQGLAGASFDQVLLEFGKMNPRPNACVIDPWNRLEIPAEIEVHETEYVRQCLIRASRFVSVTGINLTIVAHPQKLQKNKDGKIGKPGLYDISGSAHWGNIVDNGMMVYRDFKENKTEIHMLKVRFKDNGHPGTVEMSYHTSSGRYLPWEDANDFGASKVAPPVYQHQLPLQDEKDSPVW